MGTGVFGTWPGNGTERSSVLARRGPSLRAGRAAHGPGLVSRMAPLVP